MPDLSPKSEYVPKLQDKWFIVVPNPDKATIEEIQKKHPEVCLFPTTSHKFLKTNSCGSNNQSSSKTEPTVKMQNEYIKKLMINKNWNGKFDFCWLDGYRCVHMD